MKIDHIGIVVRNITEHFERYFKHIFPQDSLGPICYDPLQKVKVAFINVPGGKIELIEPASNDSPVSALIKKKPAGFYHVCLEVDDLEKQLEISRENKQIIVSVPKPAVAFHGRRVAFVLGKDMLLWEYLEAKKSVMT